MPIHDLEAPFPRLRAPPAGRPGIHDGFYLCARVLQVECRPVGAVVVGEDHGPGSGKDRIAVDVFRDPGGQHDAGPVVVAEDQGPLDGARGQHHLLGADPPEPLTRAAGRFRGQVIRPSLQGQQEVVLVVACHGGPGQDLDLRQRSQLFHHSVDPSPAGKTLDPAAAPEQSASRFVPFVHEDHAGAGASRLQGRGQAGRAGSRHEDVAVGVHVVVVVGIGAGGDHAETGGLADLMLVPPPGPRRPHEGLVVEAGRHQAREPAVDGPQVELDAGKDVDAPGRQAVVELHLGGHQVGLRAGPLSHLDQRVGLLHARGHDSPGTVVLQASRHQVDAVGQQPGGQRVSLKRRVIAPVEGEGQRLVPVDPAAGGETMGLAHPVAPGGGSPGLYTDLIR